MQRIEGEIQISSATDTIAGRAAQLLTCGIPACQFDSHLHLQDMRLKPALDAVLDAAAAAGLRGCRTCGTSPADWAAVAALSGGTKLSIHTAFGVHPWFADNLPSNWREELEGYLAAHEDAHVGEIGLDGLKNTVAPDTQKAVLKAQLEIASNLGRPVVLHGARVWTELYETLRPFFGKISAIHIHAFSGSQEQLRDWLKTDAVFSIGGGICNPKSTRIREMSMHIPADRLLFETDSPDMFPSGGASASSRELINQPSNLHCVISAYDDLARNYQICQQC